MFSGDELLRVWEIGQGQPPLERALTILAAAFPAMSRQELANLSIGQRDARLLSAREQMFGSRLAGQARCPACQGEVEFVLDVAALRVLHEDDQSEQVQQMISNDWEVQFRLPNSHDLAAIAGYTDLEAARQVLAQRCVLQASQKGAMQTEEALPELVLEALADRLAVCDPQADVQLDLTCSLCGHRWQLLFDILAFFWAELNAQAKRTLREVHLLARAYGWHEADILAMSAARRQVYLEMIS